MKIVVVVTRSIRRFDLRLLFFSYTFRSCAVFHGQQGNTRYSADLFCFHTVFFGRFWFYVNYVPSKTAAASTIKHGVRFDAQQWWRYELDENPRKSLALVQTQITRYGRPSGVYDNRVCQTTYRARGVFRHGPRRATTSGGRRI